MLRGESHGNPRASERADPATIGRLLAPAYHLCGCRTFALALALSVSVSACRGDDSSTTSYSAILHFDTVHVRLATRTDTLHLLLELATTAEQHTLGLMERRELADSAGMLFLNAETRPASDAYWMYRTRIPLDIAFIDSAGTIRTIQRMEPCTTVLAEGCPTYPAGAPFRAALEVNAGYFNRHGVRPGDHVALGDTAGRRNTESARPR